MDIAIRAAMPDDTRAIAELLGLLMAEHHVAPTSLEQRSNAIAYAAQLPGTWFFVAIVNGTVAGILQLNERYSTWSSSHYGYIEDFCVATALRSHGVGARFLEYVAAVAQERGWTRLDLDVSHSLPESIRFYERHGYSDTGSLYYRKELTAQ